MTTMFKAGEIAYMRKGINECRYRDLDSAHVATYFFWMSRKDAAWHWCPVKQMLPMVLLGP